MKESITKFDLEAAFKALDEIDIPVPEKGIKPNRLDLQENLSKKAKTDALIEEYYNIGVHEEMENAESEREAEVAKAKLARIEKIVDLEADTAEDLLPSYVGKYIIQCPQCMTLFYKDEADLEHSEEHPETVNIGEPCQHCKNTDGYTLIGKVGAIDEEEAEHYTALETKAEDTGNEETDTDLNVGFEPEELEVSPEEIETTEETEDLESVEAAHDEEISKPEEQSDKSESEEAENEKKKEESFDPEKATLVEETDPKLTAKLDAYNEYIEYLQHMISQEEEALEKADNDFVKQAIQRRLDAFKEDLDKAIPEEVKQEVATDELPTPEEAADLAEPESAESEKEEKDTADEVEECLDNSKKDLNESVETKADKIEEDIDLPAPTEANFDKLLNSEEFKKPISKEEIEALMKSDKAKAEESFEFDDIDDEKLEEILTESLTDVYENVKSFKLKDCSYLDNKFIVEGLITFKSGNTKDTKYVFTENRLNNKTYTLKGLNESLAKDGSFVLDCSVDNKNLIPESFSWCYKINENLVKGIKQSKLTDK